MTQQRQFENLTASELYCPKCRRSQPVRERLLLVLPNAELHDYRCTTCGESLGSREVRAAPVPLAGAMKGAPRRPSRRR